MLGENWYEQIELNDFDCLCAVLCMRNYKIAFCTTHVNDPTGVVLKIDEINL